MQAPEPVPAPDGLAATPDDASHNASWAGDLLLRLTLLRGQGLLQQLLDRLLGLGHIVWGTPQGHDLGVRVFAALRLQGAEKAHR